jgi:SPW repeat-containing protein
VIGAAVVNLLMGVWLLGAPYALGYDRTPAAWNSTIVGILVMAVAVVRIVRPTTTAWLSAVTLALGVWLVVASFVLDPVTTARTVNNLISAAVIVTEASVSLVYGLRAARADRPPHPLGA